MSAKILVVEDEDDVRKLMTLHLDREGYEVQAAENGEDALKILNRQSFDLLVLDWMLPGLTGVEICKKLNGQYPILMVTARVNPSDIIEGLESGADDYITKPFQVAVFLARVRALLRRASAKTSSLPLTQVETGQLLLEVESHKVFCAGEAVALTRSEFSALFELMKHRDIILSRRKMIEMIQGEGITVTERAIDTLIFGLRKKLGACADHIETVRGVGYRIRSMEPGV